MSEVRSNAAARTTDGDWPGEAEAVVVGAGMSGICLTRALKLHGIEDVVVLEKSDDVGGTWHHNRYPGVACDIPSPAYCFSFALHDWSRLFAPGAEIHDYLRQVAADNDVVRHIRFETELLEAVWDSRAHRWICETNRGFIRARFLILATGVLHNKNIPPIAGKAEFAGTMFHSSEWPEDFDPAGRRIAVVGNGASAVQFVPAVQPMAERLVVLQRTPAWVLPKNDVVHRKLNRHRAQRRQRRLRGLVLTLLELFHFVAARAERSRLVEWAARKHLRDSIKDPILRAALTPDYRINCKRVLQSNRYYPAVSSANVDYVAAGLVRITENSVIAADGREFLVDTIIWGTGFEPGHTEVLKRIRGRDGADMSGTDHAYKATTMAGCPNMFVMVGPNGITASNPLVSEAQTRYILSAIDTLHRRGVRTVEVTLAAERAWNRDKDAKLAASVWNAGGCSSYFHNDRGVNTALWPGPLRDMKEQLSVFDIENYSIT
ncbi:flavin-containing monooxygenase [Nocardia sp. NPDC057668]|uniref:flavin-containing monooxygenase n=1 Tax=Nocardia sp. NPDC057668 TaxID=3346202 RepID=UPI00366B97D6